ncbi:MAG: hypothetical protein R3A10_19295 [Caldilineaceae bacterium]
MIRFGMGRPSCCPFLLALATVGLYRLAGGSDSGAQLSLTAALLYFVLSPFMLITEETGWRGFACPACRRNLVPWSPVC